MGWSGGEEIKLLSEGARGKHFGDEVESSAVNIDPRSVESHDGRVIQILEEVYFGIKPLQLLR